MGNTNSRLFQAVENNNLQKVQKLIDNGAEINAKDEFGRTPLHSIAFWGRTEMAKLLIDNGAEINAKDDEFGRTPLHSAAYRGHTKIIKLLIENGAEIDAQDDKYGCTPLHLAIRNGRTEIANLLIDKGADINAKNYWNETPLHYILRNERLQNDQEIRSALETRFYRDLETEIKNDIARVVALQETANMVGFEDFKEKILIHMDSYQSLNTSLNRIDLASDETRIKSIIDEAFVKVEQQTQLQTNNEITQAEANRLGARPKGSKVIASETSSFSQQASTSQSQYQALATDISKKSSVTEKKQTKTKQQEQLERLRSWEPLPKIEINQEQVTEQMQATSAIAKTKDKPQLSM